MCVYIAAAIVLLEILGPERTRETRLISAAILVFCLLAKGLCMGFLSTTILLAWASYCWAKIRGKI